MRQKLITLLLAASALCANSREIFFYSPEDGTGGLRIALQSDNGQWSPLGNGYDLVKSDFGTWGALKKMWNPQLFPTPSGWSILFRATPEGDVIGWAESPDLISWKPQKYLAPADTSKLTFRTNVGFMPAVVDINGRQTAGNTMQMDEVQLEKIQQYIAQRGELAKLYSEHCDKDSERFAGLQPVSATLTSDGTGKPISPNLMGIFFEDINYAADGGLYGELIQNRDFEYRPGEGRDKDWGPGYAWRVEGDKIDFTIADTDPIHPNNPHYARLDIKGGVATLVNNGANAFINSGFDGIAVKKGEPYRLRFKARADKKIPLEFDILASHGRATATGKIKVDKSRDWKDYEIILTPDEHSDNSVLRIVPKNNGVLELDMVSLFPINTFKGRENGLRADLAQTLADLKPRFVRFPGGCVAHGNGIDNIYDWKGSIGKLEERKPLFNLWGYHQTRGLGYHEYFQFCEDIGAEPLPVLAAGVPCQNSSGPSRFATDAVTANGQQGGLPMDSLDNYIQDILDLIEYANGDVKTFWGAKRAAAGHPEPFNLKYLGIGNEDMITDVFIERFTRINKAVKKAHPEIKVVGTAGPFYEGADYEEGWRVARQENVDLVDEHYYVDPAWLIYNRDFYDNYDRKGPKVYLGEWAAHLPGRPNNVETALAEALYLTSVERNGDVVELSSYAPLLAKKGHTQWSPDLIYFTNTEVHKTADYETMRLFGEHGGDSYLVSDFSVDTDNPKVKARVGASVTKDSKTGDVIVKMVNMLPVETTVQVDLKANFKEGHGPVNARQTIMKGAPADAKPQVLNTRVTVDSPFFNITLAPYSLTVLRMPE